jgi:hypothetical protein
MYNYTTIRLNVAIETIYFNYLSQSIVGKFLSIYLQFMFDHLFVDGRRSSY